MFSSLSQWLAGGGSDGLLVLMHVEEQDVFLEVDLSSPITALTSFPGPRASFLCGQEDGSIIVTTIEENQVCKAFSP